MGTVNQQVCNTVTDQVCNTVTDQVCNTISEKVCKNIVKQIPDKQCATTTRQQCTTESIPVVDTAVVEECQDIKTEHCAETALVGVERKVAVQPVVGAAVGGAVIAGGSAIAAPGYAGLSGVRALGIIKREADAEADAQIIAGGIAPIAHAAPRC